MEQLEKDGHYNEYLEPKVPFSFLFVYNSFLELYNYSGDNLTWTDIQSYATIRKIDFKQIEIDYILKCISWANNQINEMRKGE